MKTAIYVRVSTEEQSVEAQTREIDMYLKNKGISEYQIFQDVGISGTAVHRPALRNLLESVNQGKVELVVVWRLDRLFRSLTHLISTLNAFNAKSVKFISVRENIDLTTPAGVLMMHLMGAFAQFERDIIVQRTKAGMANARAKGAQLGRPSLGNELIARIRALRAQGKSIRAISDELDLGYGTVQRATRGA